MPHTWDSYCVAAVSRQDGSGAFNLSATGSTLLVDMANMTNVANTVKLRDQALGGEYKRFPPPPPPPPTRPPPPPHPPPPPRASARCVDPSGGWLGVVVDFGVRYRRARGGDCARRAEGQSRAIRIAEKTFGPVPARARALRGVGKE